MFKELSFILRARTEFVLGWVSIVWFTSIVGSSNVIHLSNNTFSRQSTRELELQTSPQVVAQCGKNVTLECDVSSSSEFDIKKFAWMTAESKHLCQLEDGKLDHKVLCESKAEPLNKHRHRLTLTLTNMMPANQGEYICKLYSSLGVENRRTVVTLEECLGSFDFSNNQSHVECQFHGVYPNGTVHWLQGSSNLTDSATTQTEQDQHGLYNVTSTLKVQPGDMSQPYTCSLWIPASMKYLSSQKLDVVKPPIPDTSSGSSVKLQWICIMVGTLMVKFII
ncbi:programmed cell death 1 ligand 1-like [Centroberyx affinis]|uniref:programmed cell death 1 ligand 1-like n=1 Tax=Centroberyx affinis TaxID=166261 RepID=UPI003A5BFB0D